MSSTGFMISLAEFGNPVDGADCVALKAEDVSPVTIQRNPIIIPLPAGTILGLDFGRHNNVITVSGVADYELKEINVSSGSYHAGSITGNSGLNLLTSPHRATPSATVVAATSNTLMVSSVTSFFVDGESFSGSAGSGTIVKPFATKIRMEEIARYWYKSGYLTLAIGDVSYQGFVTGLSFNIVGGLEDRYQFKLQFAEAVQHLAPDAIPVPPTPPPPPPPPPSCEPSGLAGTYRDITSGDCKSLDLSGSGSISVVDLVWAAKWFKDVGNEAQWNVYEAAWYANQGLPLPNHAPNAYGMGGPYNCNPIGATDIAGTFWVISSPGRGYCNTIDLDGFGSVDFLDYAFVANLYATHEIDDIQFGIFIEAFAICYAHWHM